MKTDCGDENRKRSELWKCRGCGKRGKPKTLPTLSTSPLETSPEAGEIPTFPQLRRRGRMEKWKTKSRFTTFPPPRIYMSQNKKDRAAGGLRPSPSGGRSAPPKT